MPNNPYVSRVYSYKGYRICTAITDEDCRYLIVCPNDRLIIRAGFVRPLEASRAALQEAALLSIKDP